MAKLAKPKLDKEQPLDDAIKMLEAKLSRAQAKLTAKRAQLEDIRIKRQALLHKYVAELLPEMTTQVYRNLLETQPVFMNQPGNDALFKTIQPSLKNTLMGLLFKQETPVAHFELAKVKLAAYLDSIAYKNLSLQAYSKTASSDDELKALAALVVKLQDALARLRSTQAAYSSGKLKAIPSGVVARLSQETTTYVTHDDDNSLLTYLTTVALINSFNQPSNYVTPVDSFQGLGGTFGGAGASGGWDSSVAQASPAITSSDVITASTSGSLGSLS